MAKKTTKTNHVLNLLAGSGEVEEGTVKSPVAEKKEVAGANVQVIDSQEDGDDIAKEVNRLLEEALEESEDLKDELEESTVPEAEPAVAEKAAEPIGEAEPVANEAVAEQTAAVPEAVETKEEATSAAEPVAAVEAASAAEPVAAASPGADVAEEPKAEGTNMAGNVKAEDVKPVVVGEAELELDQEEEEPDYVFVNVMGKLVKERIKEYMVEFGNCTCSRCVADTTALALIHLPPKYVVVSKHAETPLLNFYRQHYAAQITVEITKACTRVKQHPHHDRG